MTDGFGRRLSVTDAETGEPVEYLEIAPGLAADQAFVTALGARVARLAGIRHASYVRVRRLDRPSADTLRLVSDRTNGTRLSTLLASATEHGDPPTVGAAVALLRQLLPAVALFVGRNRELAIGTLAAERLWLTGQGRLMIAEPVFGTAIDAIEGNRDTLWRDFRVALPPHDEQPRATARGDVVAIGVVALSMLVGRSLADEEFPWKLERLVASVTERRSDGERALTAAFATWLSRVLQLDAATALQSAHEAQIAFEEVLTSDSSYVTTGDDLRAWVERVAAHTQPEVEAEPLPPAVELSSTDEPETVTAAAVPAVAPLSSASLLRIPLVAALAALCLLQAVAIAWLWTRPAPGVAAGDGEVTIQSRPSAARVVIDGEERGQTPLALTLPAGTHVLELRIGTDEPRVIPFTVRVGVQTAQYVELQAPPPPSPPPPGKMTPRRQR